PGVRRSNEPDVGDEAQLEVQRRLLAGLPTLGVVRDAIERRFQGLVPASGAAPTGGEELDAGTGEVGEHLAGARVPHDGADRHAKHQIRPLRAVTVVRLALASAFGPVGT